MGRTQARVPQDLFPRLPTPTGHCKNRSTKRQPHQAMQPGAGGKQSRHQMQQLPLGVVGACSQQLRAVPGGIFGSQWSAPQSRSMQKGRAQPESAVSDAAVLSCEKLNEFRLFRTKPRSEAGASSHSCWVPSSSHSTLVGLSWSQYLLSFPSLPEMSSLLQKILYFLSCLILKVTRIGVEHLTLGGSKKKKKREKRILVH